MAQVNIDLSEYDMLRNSKTKAEAEVEELKKELKNLKDNASNVVVRNRYYIPSLDCKAAARRLIEKMSIHGLNQLIRYTQEWNHIAVDDFGRRPIDGNVLYQLTTLIESSFKEFLNLRSTYIEDSVVTEVRGFDEFATQIRNKFELEYKVVMEEKKAQLERSIESYNLKHLDVDKAVKEATDILNEKHDAKVKKLEKQAEELKDTIKTLKEQLEEASKSSVEKLADAMAKLKAAEEEVAKYSTPRKKLFGIF